MIIKIAFASHDGQHVNQHFGTAETFVIYALEPQNTRLVEVIKFAKTTRDGHEEKLINKFSCLQGCAVVYCQAIGASAIQQLLAQGIQPLKVEENTSIEELLDVLQQNLTTRPPAWLTKYLKRTNNPSRFATLGAEHWQE